LKGPHKGQLLAAISRDANNQMYQVAFAVVEEEVKDSWTWFLEALLSDLGTPPPPGGKGMDIYSFSQSIFFIFYDTINVMSDILILFCAGSGPEFGSGGSRC
jgi:hypothetical protein